MMDGITTDEKLFFSQHAAVYPLYELFLQRLLDAFPDTRVKVQKTQISYYNRHLFACVSFQRVMRKTELPDAYFVLTVCLPAPLGSPRVAAKTEPYPDRWTTHLVISGPTDLDDELFSWIAQACDFAQVLEQCRSNC